MKDIDDELAFHIEMQTRRFIDEGFDPETARAKALARLGDVTRVTEVEVSSAPWLQTLWQDTRYACRVLYRIPVFSVTTLLTLAVAIGSTTAIFSVVNAVLLRTLPYPNAGRTVVIFNSYRQAGLEHTAVAAEEFADYITESTAFEHLAALRFQASALTGDCLTADCEPERVSAYVVSPVLFDLLGVSPQLGRPFGAADGAVGAPKVVLLSDGLWRRRYGADPAIVGRTIGLAGIPRVVVGVMPRGVRFPDEAVGHLSDRADIWIPLNWEEIRDGRGNQYLVVLASRRPGISMAQAQTDLERVGEDFKSRFAHRYNEPEGHWRLQTVSLTEEMVGDVRTGLVMLFAAVCCVLLIGCANVANLLVARGPARRRELAVRSALGAGRRRLVQQLLVEALVLTGAGTLVGIGIAAAGLQFLISLNPGNIPRLESAGIDGRVLLFAAGLAVATAVVVGLLPALRQSAADPQAALGNETRGTDAASPRRRLRGLLVVTEVAMAVVVLIGAALLVRSSLSMARVPLGVNATGVAVARLSIPNASYDEMSKVLTFHRELQARLMAIPGVAHASAVYPLPMSGGGWSGSVGIDGRLQVPLEPEPHAEYAVVLPGYFSTLGIPLLDGRDFAASDTIGAPAVVIVDRDFARRYWPGQSAVGQRIATFGGSAGRFQTVIGVVGHVRNKGARNEGEPQVYMPVLQRGDTSLFFVARTAGDPSGLPASIRAAVREQDARLPIGAVSTMDDVLASFTARERFTVTLFTIFGVVALMIAAVGLYGVLAFLVTQRWREIGIRLALGGRPGALARSVVTEGLILTSIGLAVGVIGGFWLGRAMRELLFVIEPDDPPTYVAIAIVMFVVTLLAALGPARRVTRVDPVRAVR